MKCHRCCSSDGSEGGFAPGRSLRGEGSEGGFGSSPDWGYDGREGGFPKGSHPTGMLNNVASPLRLSGFKEQRRSTNHFFKFRDTSPVTSTEPNFYTTTTLSGVSYKCAKYISVEFAKTPSGA